MNNILNNNIVRAGLLACLFLFLLAPGHAQPTADPTTLTAYNRILSASTIELASVTDSSKPFDRYVWSLNKTLRVVLTEDPNLYRELDNNLDLLLSQAKQRSAEELFVDAEVLLHNSFINVKFGHEMDAAWSLRQSYLTAMECLRRYPTYVPIRKTTGLLHVMIGSIPEKYNWILSLLDMEGNVDEGIAELESVQEKSWVLGFEAQLLQVLAHGYILQDSPEAAQRLDTLEQLNPGNKLIALLTGAIALKNSDAETAIRSLSQLETDTSALLTVHHYLRGEALLEKGEYVASRASFDRYLTDFKGTSNLKDATYKIAICHLLEDRKHDAQHWMRKVATIGSEQTEADRYAARSSSAGTLPNMLLTRARYFTDGGLYGQAERTLASITPAHLESEEDRIEFPYRQARLAHKRSDYEMAKRFYLVTLEKSKNAKLYYAPNASLQLGYIYMDEGNYSLAEEYLLRARSYKGHAYKNSIDSKAKAALGHISRLK